MILNYAPHGPLRGRFPLPLHNPATDRASGFPHITWAYLIFTKDDVVIRYYTFGQDSDIFRMGYVDGSWYMFLENEADTDWIPSDGCDWKFAATDLDNKVLAGFGGEVEVWKRV